VEDALVWWERKHFYQIWDWEINNLLQNEVFSIDTFKNKDRKQCLYYSDKDFSSPSDYLRQFRKLGNIDRNITVEQILGTSGLTYKNNRISPFPKDKIKAKNYWESCVLKTFDRQIEEKLNRNGTLRESIDF